MSTKIIQVELLQNVMNPRGHLDGFSFSKESYNLMTKGEYAEFMYDSSNITAKEQRLIDNIKAGKSFPIALGTKRECFATKFMIVFHGDYQDDETYDY